MSWNGLKKSFNRAGTTLMQKTGQVDRTVDNEFDSEVAKYRVLEKELNSLHKDAKSYLDAMRAMTSSEARLAETIELFYSAAELTSDGAMAGHAYKRAVDELDTGVGRDLDQPYRHTVLEPIGRFCSYFQMVNAAIEKRNKKLLDYDAARTRMRKLAEKGNDDVTKLPRAQQENDEAEAVYEVMNSTLLEGLPQMVELRVPYLDPSFESMVRCQLKFAEEGYEKMSGVQRYFADNVRDEYASGMLDSQVETVLAEMKDLSIYGSG
ncbi:bar-domain-containing protein [Phaffia rhodozyma]|uniref:Bar-domain-containing protein n=1 Tax=Phaffia rhodozyma TaxID=264483 RepID=A0A0F7SM95_PHARH|nr:bar-domain-containing protein [Phaffia rhodozyma]